MLVDHKGKASPKKGVEKSGSSKDHEEVKGGSKDSKGSSEKVGV